VTSYTLDTETHSNFVGGAIESQPEVGSCGGSVDDHLMVRGERSVKFASDEDLVAGRAVRPDGGVDALRDSDGRTRKAQRTGRSAAAAEAALRAALRDRFAPTAEILTRESTMAELAAKWLEQVRSDRKAAATVARYESTVAKHIEAIRDVRIREAGTARLDRLVARVAEKSGTAQARMVAVVLSGMMKLAVRYDAARTNTAAGIRAPSVDIRDARAPTIDEIRTMREALRLYDQRPAHRSGSLRDLADLGDFLVGTAARPGEALALRWVDVDLDAATVTICGTVTRVPGEGLRRQE
jgi:integrase